MAISSDRVGILGGIFQVEVSGDVASFFAKYGDRAARMNLCKLKEVVSVVRVISDVCGILRLSSDVR